MALLALLCACDGAENEYTIGQCYVVIDNSVHQDATLASAMNNMAPGTFCRVRQIMKGGAVYYDQARAEEGSHLHCDCITICMGESTTIEGYDPDALYDLWQDRLKSTAMSRAKANDTSYQIERMKIMDSYKESARRAHKVHKYRYRR